MTAEHRAEDLRTELLNRARKHAEEIRAHGRDAAERITQEKQADLGQREERERQQAQATAQRVYRQLWGSARLKVRGELERLRWTLAQSVLERAKQRLQEVGDDEDRYRPVFKQLLDQAVQMEETDPLVAEVNERDQARLKGAWDDLLQDIAPSKTIEVADKPSACLGGVVVRDPDNRIRIDETFDGRILRYHHDLMRTLLDRLFGTIEPMEELEDG